MQPEDKNKKRASWFVRRVWPLIHLAILLGFYALMWGLAAVGMAEVAPAVTVNLVIKVAACGVGIGLCAIHAYRSVCE